PTVRRKRRNCACNRPIDEIEFRRWSTTPAPLPGDTHILARFFAALRMTQKSCKLQGKGVATHLAALLRREVTYLQSAAGCAVHKGPPVVQTGHRILFGAEGKVRTHGLLRAARGRHEDRIGMGRNINCQTEVIAGSARVRDAGVKVAAPVARLDDSRGGKSHDVGKAREGGLRPFRDPYR